MKRKSLYIVLLGFSLLSYGWLFFNYQTNSISHSSGSICIFKNITTIPCPACGTTRSVLSILEGNLFQVLQYNALGFVAFLLLVLIPIWIVFDLLFKKSSLHRAYQNMEVQLQNKLVSIPLIAIVLANWVWNVTKML